MRRRRVESAITWTMLRTRHTPLRHLWRALHLGTASLAAAWIARPGGCVQIAGSLAHGEPLYGLSDIDLVVIAADPAGRERLARRVALMYRLIPPLQRLMGHVWVYDEAGFLAATADPFPVYGLATRHAAFLGARAPRDPMGLLERPGLLGPGGEWRALRSRPGVAVAAPAARSRQQERLAAWLELQYRWKIAYMLLAESDPLTAAARSASLVAEAARIWLWLARGESVFGRRAPLRRAGERLAEERGSLELAVRVLDRLPRVIAGAPRELWASFVRMSMRIAGCIEGELSSAGVTAVTLDGGRGCMPLRDWPGLALPLVDWSPPDGPVVPVESFSIVGEDATDLGAALDAAAATTVMDWRTMRAGRLLLRPSRCVWGRGRLRGIEISATDPVSFALIDGRQVALFPNVSGWSARDRAVRAVAEHRAWLHDESSSPPAGPGWVGRRPPSTSPTAASVSLLLSAARAALFEQSVDAGAPRLGLTDDATVALLARQDPQAAEPASRALGSLIAGVSPDHGTVMRLRSAVVRIPQYSTRVAG
jgi:hypothetical protein